MSLLSSADFLHNKPFQKNSFRNTICSTKVSNGLDPGRTDALSKLFAKVISR